MAVTVNSGSLSTTLAATVASGTGATHPASSAWTRTFKDTAGTFIFDRSWFLTDYSLTVAAGAFSIDLYDLGTIDLGAGAGLDNLGLAHANARILGLAIRNQEVTSGTGVLTIDQVGATTTAWTGFGHADVSLSLNQGGEIVLYWGETGRTVTDTTDHILRLVASTATCTIDVAFLSAQS